LEEYVTRHESDRRRDHGEGDAPGDGFVFAAGRWRWWAFCAAEWGGRWWSGHCHSDVLDCATSAVWVSVDWDYSTSTVEVVYILHSNVIGHLVSQLHSTFFNRQQQLEQQRLYR